MPDNSINTSKFPNKKFIFGPHFSVFPNYKLENIKNDNNNCKYIQPSKWVCQLWNNVNTILPVETFPFPVDISTFKPISTNRNKVFIYFKRRKLEELTLIINFLKSKKIEFHIFDYVKRYEEKQYIKYLQESKYGIILDAHESQGFAIEEALSCNVPLLVWNVRSMNQETGVNYPNIPATSIPYWDNRCGEYFYIRENLEKIFNKFINNINSYNPREFILETLTTQKCSINFNNLIKF